MKQILAIDIGTGTQDIFLLRPGLSPENGYKLVMPSPTMRIRAEIRDATRLGEALLLSGVTMGGGPCHWAAEAHLKAGFSLYATPEAARTFNDDLEWVQSEMGVQIVAEDEAEKLSRVRHIQLRDLDLDALHTALLAFDVELKPGGVAVAVFDHGAAPPEVSDRKFRFDFITRQLERSNQLTTFAFTADAIPQELTRMQAVRDSIESLDFPLMLMDTAPAAALGATLDPLADSLERKLIANIGNYHTLAFRLGPDGVEGVFEHHTGLLDQVSLERLLRELADGTISGEQIFRDQGHGAVILSKGEMQLQNDPTNVVITGPRRQLMAGSSLTPYFAAPVGDMMLSGCFGLLLAAAEHLPDLRMDILDSFTGRTGDTAPWDLEPGA